jgi:ribosome recycling factor
VAIRNIRREAVDTFKKMEKDSKISEDTLKDLEIEIQKITDAKIVEIDKTVETKNKEIMKV